MTDTWKPPGYNSVSPYLVTKNAQGIIDFLHATLGVRIDDTVVMIGEAPPGWSAVPCHIHLYGGESVQAPVQKGDPDRRSGVKGPGGNTWWFSTQVES